MKFRVLTFVGLALTCGLLVACQPMPLVVSISAEPAAQPAVADTTGAAARNAAKPMADLLSQCVVAGAAGSTAALVQPKAKAECQSVVTDSVGPSRASDPAQARAEDEFLAVAKAKEQAYYDGDAKGTLSYYADNAISVQPETPDIIGRAALAKVVEPYLESNRVVGHLNIKRIWVYGDHATRQAEWEEVVSPKNGGPAEHHIGRCTLNWEKIDGQWKVTSEYINYLVPPTEIKQ